MTGVHRIASHATSMLTVVWPLTGMTNSVFFKSALATKPRCVPPLTTSIAIRVGRGVPTPLLPEPYAALPPHSAPRSSTRGAPRPSPPATADVGARRAAVAFSLRIESGRVGALELGVGRYRPRTSLPLPPSLLARYRRSHCGYSLLLHVPQLASRDKSSVSVACIDSDVPTAQDRRPPAHRCPPRAHCCLRRANGYRRLCMCIGAWRSVRTRLPRITSSSMEIASLTWSIRASPRGTPYAPAPCYQQQHGDRVAELVHPCILSCSVRPLCERAGSQMTNEFKSMVQHSRTAHAGTQDRTSSSQRASDPDSEGTGHARKPGVSERRMQMRAHLWDSTPRLYPAPNSTLGSPAGGQSVVPVPDSLGRTIPILQWRDAPLMCSVPTVSLEHADYHALISPLLLNPELPAFRPGRCVNLVDPVLAPCFFGLPEYLRSMSGIDHRACCSSPLALAPRSLVRALGVVSSNGKFDSPAMLSAEHGLRSLIMEPGECEKWQKM
ncbi:hypothetical protein DFH09DRAFT_1332579 [Mycena vulgaris]|nr:hypothetical protein DFH09DRAFT_1332579 [Mycena vulgaris]